MRSRDLFACPKCNTTYDEAPPFCGVCGANLENLFRPSPDEDLLIGRTIDKRYRILDLLGSGGMGAVYRVEHVQMGKLMAMKVLQGDISREIDMTRRFRREAETVSRLTHINTVNVFDFGSEGELMYLVMEYIEGRDLADYLEEEGPVPFVDAAKMMIQVCSSLMEAHSKGIVHRDLKPENIFLTQLAEQTDFIKVLDFGLAKLRDMQDRTRITAQGSIVGTPFYMAPEHCRGEAVDHRSDIYALGAVLYKLLTGDPPFSGKTPMSIITRHLTEEPQAPSVRAPQLGIPAQADRIVLKALSKDPLDRYQSAEAMRRALADALEELSPGSEFRRFSSFHPGSAPTPEISRWEDTSPRSEESLPQKTPVATFPGTGSPDPSSLRATQGKSKSVMIGKRELPIAEKSDFDDFENNIQRRRGLWTFVGLLLAIIALTLAAGYLILARQSAGPSKVEREPNDQPAEATLIGVATPAEGRIAPSIQGREDVDWYVLPGASGAWAVDVSVTAVPGLDIALQLVDPERDEPLAVANLNGPGGPERIWGVVLEIPRVYVVVQEVRAAGTSPGAFPNHPYQIVYHVLDASVFEREPNDVIATSTPAFVGASLFGTLSQPNDVDWFCLPPGEVPGSIQVTSDERTDLALRINFGPNGKVRIVDDQGPGAQEVALLEDATAPVCLAVERSANTQQDAAQGVYQIVFQ